jgi:hypothetical protein
MDPVPLDPNLIQSSNDIFDVYLKSVPRICSEHLWGAENLSEAYTIIESFAKIITENRLSCHSNNAQHSLVKELEIAQAIQEHARRKQLKECTENLNFLRFTGDRDTRPSTVDWFLKEILRYVHLKGQHAWGFSFDAKAINALLSFLSQEKRAGKDRAFRWAASWIGSQAEININNNIGIPRSAPHLQTTIGTYSLSPGCNVGKYVSISYERVTLLAFHPFVYRE